MGSTSQYPSDVIARGALAVPLQIHVRDLAETLLIRGKPCVENVQTMSKSEQAWGPTRFPQDGFRYGGGVTLRWVLA
jgi:hypothetical protein